MENLSVIRIKKLSQGALIDRLLFGLISVFVVYTVWYQYAFEVIPGFLPICGIALVGLSAAELLSQRKYALSSVIFIFVFFVFAGITGWVFAKYPASFNRMLVLILEYMLPMCAIILYVGSEEKRFNNILSLFFITTLLLSATVIFHGTLTSSTAITVGDYNTNTLSCNLMVGCFATLLCMYGQKKKSAKVFFYLAVLLELAAQLLVASRRGTIVHILMLLLYVYSVNKIKLSKNKLLKGLIAFGGIFAAAYVAIILCGDRMKDWVIIQRFMGNLGATSGDASRKYYQAVAQDLFKGSPLIGVGLGGVDGAIGVYSHSMYYETLACTGTIGLIILVAGFGWYLFKFHKNCQAVSMLDTATRFRNLYGFWFVICVLVAGIAVVFLYDVFFYYILALLAALTNVTKKKRLELRQKERECV